jgi:hypothetical protein
MAEFKCPLCKQSVTEELFERITGIWKERRVAEKRFKEKEKELLKKRIEDQKQIELERKKMRTEQKTIIEQKIAEKTRKYDSQIQKMAVERNKIKERFDKKIINAVKAAERKAHKDINKEVKLKLSESVKKEVEKATSKTRKDLFRANNTIESTKKQMSTLQKNSLAQQEKISNLERQLKNQTTPQIEGLLYEDNLLEALKKEFPEDTFEHPGKSGDILHYINLEKKPVGLIAYECKRVSQWQTSHLEQTAKAKLERKADYAVLVTNTGKKGLASYLIEKGVIVVPPGGAIAMASIIRQQIISIAKLKLTQAQRDEAIEKTLEYLQGPEFKNSLDVVIRKTEEMYEDLKKECHDHLKNWKKRHECLKTVYLSSSQVHTRTAALIAGKGKEIKETEIQPFPALPDLKEI